MTRIVDLHRQWLTDPEYRTAYDELENEFTAVASALRQRKTRAPQAMRFVIFRRVDGSYGWSMISASGAVVAQSLDGFATRDEARKAITQFKLRTSRAPITDAVA